MNVISLKLILSPPNLPADTSLESYINSFLPPTIRLWSFIRVQGSFNPRGLCDQRHYEYTIPTHMFLGPKPGTAMDIWIQKSRATTVTPSAAIAPVAQAASGSPLIEEVKLPVAPTALETSAAAAIADSDKFWAAQPKDSVFADDLAAKRAWRISEGLLASIQEFFTAYEGSHNYYNYTVAKDFRDRSCQRVMKKLDVGSACKALRSSLTCCFAGVRTFRRQRHRVRLDQLPRPVLHASPDRTFLSSFTQPPINLPLRPLSAK